MDVLELIKQRKTIRRYKEKPISSEIIDKIVEAGTWGPSVPSFLQIQPWRFIVISNKNSIARIANLILKESKKSTTGVNIMLHSASNIIKGAPIIILVYNSRDLEEIKHKFKVIYSKFSKIIKTAQLSAISAAIQNMILAAEALGVGSCWLDTPLFCQKEINELLDTTDELIAVLTFGYRIEEGKRSIRKPLSETVRHIR